jgi:hypothetical protein
MTNKLTNVLVALVLGGGLAAGTLTSCDDDDDNLQVTGTAGRGGTTGGGGTTATAGRGGTGTGGTATGGTGGGPATTIFNMRPTGSQEVPPNNSAAISDVRVTLNQTTGEVVVDGTFSGLTSNVTVAHIHGPAGVGTNAAPIIDLTVTGTTSGTVSGTGTMSAPQMNEMIGGMTYVNIHSANFPMGEIRAQVLP